MNNHGKRGRKKPTAPLGDAMTIERVQASLKKLGPPSEVLPACMYIFAINAKSSGATAEQFMAWLLPFILSIWNEDAFDPQEMAKAIAEVAIKQRIRAKDEYQR